MQIGPDHIEYVNTYKYLGVLLDSNLTFIPFVNSTMKLVAYKVYLLSKLRKFLTSDAALKVYKAKIIPYFDYGDIFYRNVTNTLRVKLQRIQNRPLRVCLCSQPREPVQSIHIQAGVPFLHYRRVLHLRNIAFTRKGKSKYVDSKDSKSRKYDAPVLRSIIPWYKIVQNSVLYGCAEEWNKLDVNTRGITDLGEFKKKQKEWLKSTIGNNSDSQ